MRRVTVLLATLLAGVSAALGSVRAQDTAAVRIRRDSVRIRFVETELIAVINAMATLLDKPLIAVGIPSVRVSFETPVPIPRSDVRTLLKGLVGSHSLSWEEDSAFYRVTPQVQEQIPQPAPQSSPGQTQLELFVHRLRHAKAGDVAGTIGQLFGTGGGMMVRPGLATGTLSDELRRAAVPPAAPETPAVQAEQARPASLSGAVTIVPDELTNSLLIRAARADFEVLRQAIDQLDVRPLQALIEVLIVEARKDRSFALGVSVDYRRQDGVSEYAVGFGSAGAGDVVVQFMRMARSEVSALLSAAQARGDVQIVSRPVLLASNNTEAHFLVGSQRPFVQVSRSLPTDVPSRDQVIQYRDVGTKLTVRPTINEDGYVSLLIQQEISSATDETQFGAPVIATREARTQVLVKDGQTIVLGGLTDLQRDRVQSGIPVLSGIPILGGLFGSSRRRSTATELFLFLTPRIIRNDADVDSLTTPRLPPAEREPRRP